MPLRKGKSKKVMEENMSELMTGKVGKTRKKALKTMMKKGMTMKTAKMKQARAITRNLAGKKKKK